MNSSKFLKIFLLIFLLGNFFLMSCTTEDILPAASLEAETTNLSEDNGTLQITVTLNSVSTAAITIPLNFSGSATNADYTLSSSSIIIPSGLSSGNITISSTQDQSIEGTETIIVSLASSSDFLLLGNQDLTISLLDDDTDSDNDGVLDANDNCPNTPGDINNDGCPFLGFLINEVNYDPASGAAGDANGDGTRSPLEDEFIEFFNSGNELDISGYTIEDASELRHTFPSGSIVPRNGVIVVFGGGTPTGSFGGAVVQTASEGQLNMSNSGDFMTIKDANGVVVLTFDIEPLSNNPNEAYTRNPDLTGEFVQHAGIPEANGVLFSPGTKLDGSSF